MDTFSSYGYNRIKPPLLEFEDSLFAPGPGALLAPETFRLMDPVTHRMLGIRSDVTAQVARIVTSRLSNEGRPLRLMYANDVLRIRGTQMRTERQFTQVGCELIFNQDSAQTDVEIGVLSLVGLKALGLENLTIDLNVPGFVASLLNEISDVEAIKIAVERRDIDALHAMETPHAKTIATAMGAAGEYKHAFEVIKGLDVSADLKQKIDRLFDVCQGVEAALSDLNIDDVSITVDLLEQGGFEYHEMIGFTLFARDIGSEVGRGGRYNVHFGQDDSADDARDQKVATGFTLYMDAISKSIEAPAPKKTVFIPFGAPWSVIDDLHKQGWRIVRALDKNEAPHGCTHIYADGGIQTV